MQSRDSQQFQQGLRILTFKSLKWRNCPTTLRVEHVIRISLGTVKYNHPFSSEDSPFSFGNHFCGDKSAGKKKKVRITVKELCATTKTLSGLYELAMHRHLLMNVNIWN